MQNFLINFKQNLIQIYTKTHQIAPFKKIIGGHAPNSLEMRLAFPIERKNSCHPTCYDYGQ